MGAAKKYWFDHRIFVSIRIIDALKRHGVTTIEEAKEINDVDLLKLPGFGRGSLEELRLAIKLLDYEVDKNEMEDLRGSEADWQRRYERERKKRKWAEDSAKSQERKFKEQIMAMAEKQINPPVIMEADSYSKGVTATELKFKRLFGRLYWRRE